MGTKKLLAEHIITMHRNINIISRPHYYTALENKYN